MLQKDETTIHGTFVNIFGLGSLITGNPGIGKSELALSLLHKHHQLIADDAPLFYLEKGDIYGRNILDQAFISIRGIGLFDPIRLFGPNSVKDRHKLDLIIHLEQKTTSSLLSSLEGEPLTKDILGRLIPGVTIPIISPRNLDVLVETIVKHHLLKSEGNAAMASFDKLIHQKIGQSYS